MLTSAKTFRTFGYGRLSLPSTATKILRKIGQLIFRQFLSVAFGADCLPQEAIEEYERIYRKILAAAGEIESPRIESKRMVNRMSDYEQETLVFMYDFDVPFANNLAERDIRMPKRKQKISGGFRSEDGADWFARIRGYVSTAIKRGKNVYDGLIAVFNGDSYDFMFSASPST